MSVLPSITFLGHRIRNREVGICMSFLQKRHEKTCLKKHSMSIDTHILEFDTQCDL